MTSPTPTPSLLQRAFTPMSLRGSALWALVLIVTAMLLTWGGSALGTNLQLASALLLAGAVYRSRPKAHPPR